MEVLVKIKVFLGGMVTGMITQQTNNIHNGYFLTEITNSEAYEPLYNPIYGYNLVFNDPEETGYDGISCQRFSKVRICSPQGES